ncbi:MAG: TenA family transcriptional regulator, partial [Nitrososphaerales archaeon]
MHIRTMQSLVERINREVEERSLLKHPFYEMWSRGQLSLDDLSSYSKEYFQLVKTVPDLVQNILDRMGDQGHDAMIRESLKEEKEHVELWVRFARSLGVPQDELDSYRGFEGTRQAVEKLKRATSDSIEEAVAAMYAY